jgi:hypothetical protein
VRRSTPRRSAASCGDAAAADVSSAATAGARPARRAARP